MMMAHSATSIPLACVIVNYNVGSLLEDCVKSWLKSAPGAPLVIVDNASTDGSLDFISSLSGTDTVSVIHNPRNVGFSVAVNQGFRSVTSDLMLLLNPDCLLTPEAIANMVAVFDGKPRIGVVGPLLLNPDGSEQAGGRRAVPTPWRSLVRAVGLSRLGKRYPRLFSDFLLHAQCIPDQPIEVEAISGACMLVRREALDDVGLLDEGYFLHCEDLDWCMRFRQKEWGILFAPDAKIVHHKGACSRSRPIFVEWHKHKGMLRFYRKFFRHQYPGVLMWLVAVGVWLRFGAVAGVHMARHVARALGLGRG